MRFHNSFVRLLKMFSINLDIFSSLLTDKIFVNNGVQFDFSGIFGIKDMTGFSYGTLLSNEKTLLSFLFNVSFNN